MLRPEKHAHFTDFNQIRKDAFILLNLGYGLNRLLNDPEGDVASRRENALFRDYGAMYENETSLRLISIAIASRIMDDRLIDSCPEAAATRFVHDELLGDDEEGEALNLRQCFNKIIHATGINHELQLPEVYLFGKHQSDKGWHVRLFLLPFCTAVYQWVDQYQKPQIT